MLESQVEQTLIRKVKKLGGICEKFTSPGRRSVPDRIVTLPNGRVIFIELKSPGKKPTRAQALDHGRRRSLGCDVRVIDNIISARSFPDEPF